jgi:uncharacterized protein
VCVAFVDVFVQKGYKLRGTAEVVWRSNPRYAALAAPLERVTGGRFPIAAVIYIDVVHAEPIVAPSYRLVPRPTESQLVEAAMRTYGVRSAAKDPD